MTVSVDRPDLQKLSPIPANSLMKNIYYVELNIKTTAVGQIAAVNVASY